MNYQFLILDTVYTPAINAPAAGISINPAARVFKGKGAIKKAVPYSVALIAATNPKAAVAAAPKVTSAVLRQLCLRYSAQFLNIPGNLPFEVVIGALSFIAIYKAIIHLMSKY